MSACFGATVRAPLTALLMIFEMTNRFAVVPALMVGTVGEPGVRAPSGGKWNSTRRPCCRTATRRTRSTAARPPVVAAAASVRVLNLRPVVVTNRSPNALREFMVEHRFKAFPVVADGRYAGVGAAAAMVEAVARGREPAIEARRRSAATTKRSRRRRPHGAGVVSTSPFCVDDERPGRSAASVTLHDLFRAQRQRAVWIARKIAKDWF